MAGELKKLTDEVVDGLANLGRLETATIRTLVRDTGTVTTITNGEVVKIERFGKVVYRIDEKN